VSFATLNDRNEANRPTKPKPKLGKDLAKDCPCSRPRHRWLPRSYHVVVAVVTGNNPYRKSEKEISDIRNALKDPKWKDLVKATKEANSSNGQDSDDDISMSGAILDFDELDIAFATNYYPLRDLTI